MFLSLLHIATIASISSVEINTILKSDDSFVFREPRGPKAVTVSRMASAARRVRDLFPKCKQASRKSHGVTAVLPIQPILL